jgi:zinc protease
MLEKAFASWKPKLKALPKITPPKTPEKTQVIYIEMSLPQTTFLLGVSTIAGRNHPDQEVLSVFNDILGGSGFDSLLMEEIRSNRGLAYGVSSDLDVAADFGGALNIVGQTKAESTVEAIKLALDILDKTRSGALIRDENLNRAKDASLNSFVFRFVSPFSLALQVATYDLFGFSSDYMTKLPEKIKAVTKEDIAKAATKDIDTSKIVLIVVGNKKRFDKPLSALGLGQPEEMPAPNLKFKPLVP